MKLVELPKGGMGQSRRDGPWGLDSGATTIKRLYSERVVSCVRRCYTFQKNDIMRADCWVCNMEVGVDLNKNKKCWTLT